MKLSNAPPGDLRDATAVRRTSRPVIDESPVASLGQRNLAVVWRTSGGEDSETSEELLVRTVGERRHLRRLPPCQVEATEIPSLGALNDRPVNSSRGAEGMSKHAGVHPSFGD